MRNGTRDTALPLSYTLSLNTYVLLQETRNHLRLLHQISRSPDKDRQVLLYASALSDCFDRLATELDDALDAIAPVEEQDP